MRFALGFVAFLRTVLTLLVLAVYILLLAPPLLVWTALSGSDGLLYLAGDAGVRLGFALVGIRIRVLGDEYVQRQRSAVYAANHSSNIDPPAVFRALVALHPRLRTIYKAELRRIPVLVWVFDAARFVPIERANREQSLPAIDRAVQSLISGDSFVIFPEGTRSRTGELLPFKKGGFVMAIGAQAPIVPVAVSGGRDAMRKGSLVVRPVTITVEFRPPIETAGLTRGDRDALSRAVRASIAERLPLEPQ